MTGTALDFLTDRLYEVGFRCCGASNKSVSVYYAECRDERGYARIRISDHSVAHACSDCAVCIEIGDGSADADIIVASEATAAACYEAADQAIKLFRSKCPEEIDSD